MSEQTFTTILKAGARPLDLGELTIEMNPEWRRVHYIGTRMQLEAEGIIPGKPCWPDGFTRADGEANGIHFTLRRVRPEGVKGPRRAFLDCDNWKLTMYPADREFDDRALEFKAKELRDMAYARTPQGRAENDAKWKRYYAACDDKQFQAFKALIPGLIPPPRKPRGRPPKAVTTAA